MSYREKMYEEITRATREELLSLKAEKRTQQNSERNRSLFHRHDEGDLQHAHCPRFGSLI
jgi:hypothetical protein